MSLITPQEAKKISFDKHSGYSPLRDDSDYIVPIIHYLIQHEASLGETDLLVLINEFPIRANMDSWKNVIKKLEEANYDVYFKKENYEIIIDWNYAK